MYELGSAREAANEQVMVGFYFAGLIGWKTKMRSFFSQSKQAVTKKQSRDYFEFILILNLLTSLARYSHIHQKQAFNRSIRSPGFELSERHC